MNAKSKNSTLADLKITRVFSGGQDVVDGGTIFSARANFTVTGPVDARLQLLIDDVPKYNGQTNNAGDLSFLIDDLPDGRHEYRLAHEEERTDPFILNAVATKPFIETLKDSNGNVENGGSTEDTDLSINGLWKEGQIWILNGAAAEPIAMFRVGTDRTWGGDLKLATGKIHTLKARADDRSVSDLYTVTVGEVSEGEVKITSLKDSEEGEIEDGDTTADTTLTITGSAKDGEVKLLDGDSPTPIKTFTAADGTWGGEIELTAGKTYVLKAEDVDGKQSETHTVIVSEASEGEVKITSLKDSEGGEIEDGETTADTTLAITGSAKDGEVKLLDGDNPTPIKTFTAADGTWGGDIELTAGKTYVLKAEDVDGKQSETHTVIVSEVPEVDLRITSLTDSEREVENGGNTDDTTLTIGGTAKDGEIELLEGANTTPIETFTAANGIWGGEFVLAADATYVLKAKDATTESETYTVTVNAAPPETRVKH
ncbi:MULTISPECIES: hypothetical protein [unclassified Pseudomonas]|uniref:hypothetical protein n=1 Tax=unclassified Pseudomonas TaxID=196821 RepID=UPI000FDDB674|nr:MULTISPECIES: hypothetical protein [unclassified Pseudomonas]AZZ74104.1 hypothetical protein CCX46_02790 [Pseudomonas sp. RU47]QHF48605.1 hypothetical protein PspS49_02875 [Pseudomonas sp. S49]WNZ84889.1 hypothetical protein QOM10_02765 [Pseudomonas sp. P108]